MYRFYDKSMTEHSVLYIERILQSLFQSSSQESTRPSTRESKSLRITKKSIYVRTYWHLLRNPPHKSPQHKDCRSSAIKKPTSNNQQGCLPRPLLPPHAPRPPVYTWHMYTYICDFLVCFGAYLFRTSTFSQSPVTTSLF